MSPLLFEISPISDLALQVMQAVLAKNEQQQTFADDDSGPLAVAAALSDFFQLTSALEENQHQLEREDMTDLADYGLDLLDRLSYLVRQLEVMDQRDNMARVFASTALWLVRRDAVLDNLEGAADGFGMLVNGLTDPKLLGEMCQHMEEVLQAASDRQQLDEDRSNPWRPWRVLSLNSGIAATRSLDPDLMESTFEKLGRRIPYDMPGFLADGKRQMAVQNVPDEVQEVMNRFVAKWPGPRPH